MPVIGNELRTFLFNYLGYHSNRENLIKEIYQIVLDMG